MTLRQRVALFGLDRFDLRLVVYALVLLPGTVVAPVAGMVMCCSAAGRRFTSEQKSWILLIGACNAFLSAILLFRLGGALLVAMHDALVGPWGWTSPRLGHGTLDI